MPARMGVECSVNEVTVKDTDRVVAVNGGKTSPAQVELKHS